MIERESKWSVSLALNGTSRMKMGAKAPNIDKRSCRNEARVFVTFLYTISPDEH